MQIESHVFIFAVDIDGRKLDMTYIYSPEYNLDLESHVFPLGKYKMIISRLISNGIITEEEIVTPAAITNEEILTVHTQGYLEDLIAYRNTVRTLWSEIPLTPEIVNVFLYMSGGTVEAVKQAADLGWAVNVGGGFHHSFPDRAEGFCYLNDLAIGARFALTREGIDKVAVVDCDLHQGNGTAAIFQGDDDVFTYSIHQKNLYPPKEYGDFDVALEDAVEDGEYLEKLEKTLGEAFPGFDPDMIIYQAGADPYKEDQLGSLNLSKEGLIERDRIVMEKAKDLSARFAVTLGGGYAPDTNDTAEIHFNTCVLAKDIFG